MDKRDFRDYLIVVSKIYLSIVLVVGIPFNGLVSLMMSLSGESFLDNFISNISTMMIAFFILGIIIYSIFGIVVMMSKKKRKADMVEDQSYVRDIPTNLAPAIASILLDSSIEVTTDYTATITNLMAMDYIDINYETEEITLKKDNLEKLLSHEKYTLECLIHKDKCDLNKFKELLIYDAKSEGLIVDGKRKIHFIRNIIICIIAFIIVGILGENYKDTEIVGGVLQIMQVISGVAIFGVIAFSIYSVAKYSDENFIRTPKGLELAKQCMGIKRFIHDFSLLSQKNISDTVIWDKYIPFAISLNEATTIEKYIYNNDKYRKIIYGKINNFTK